MPTHSPVTAGQGEEEAQQWPRLPGDPHCLFGVTHTSHGGRDEDNSVPEYLQSTWRADAGRRSQTCSAGEPWRLQAIQKNGLFCWENAAVRQALWVLLPQRPARDLQPKCPRCPPRVAWCASFLRDIACLVKHSIVVYL